MKKLIALTLLAGSFFFASCDGKKTSETTENEEVVDTDTVSTEHEVEQTVVERDTTVDVDTTTETKTVETPK